VWAAYWVENWGPQLAARLVSSTAGNLAAYWAVLSAGRKAASKAVCSAERKVATLGLPWAAKSAEYLAGTLDSRVDDKKAARLVGAKAAWSAEQSVFPMAPPSVAGLVARTVACWACWSAGRRSS
jgi:hypothetical protein